MYPGARDSNDWGRRRQIITILACRSDLLTGIALYLADKAVTNGFVFKLFKLPTYAIDSSIWNCKLLVTLRDFALIREVFCRSLALSGLHRLIVCWWCTGWGFFGRTISGCYLKVLNDLFNPSEVILAELENNVTERFVLKSICNGNS